MTAAQQQQLPQQVQEVFENQRLFGVLGWKAPLSVLDCPAWTHASGSGAAVALAEPPSAESAAWEPVITPATDKEGFQYATVFKHLEYKRAGGRSSARFGDTVRRRLWRRCASPAGAAAPAVALPREATAGGSAAAAAAGAAAASTAAQEGAAVGDVAAAAGVAMAAAEASRQAREEEAKRQAVKAFISMVLDLLSRRSLFTLVPWDPAALYFLWQKHQKVYQELQAQAFERKLFTADQQAPPSQLREGRTLLQDLICAAMHARAAYGFPAAAGMMGSVGDYIRLQTIQPLTFDAVGGVSVEANNESVAALAGIPPEDILMAEWRNSPYRPCHYVALDRANQCIVISVRGSLQVGDLLSDLAAAPMEVSIGGSEGWVHQGIFSAATFIHCNTAEALEEAARRCPGWPVLLTGHSLGGGVAALLTLLLQEAGLPQGLGPLRCITLGTAAVMSAPLAEACNELVTSVVLGSDVVPHLSYASVEAVLLEASQASPVRRTMEEWGSKLAGALNKGVAKQGELSDAAAAAIAASPAKIAGSWTAVKQASQNLRHSASSSRGLSRIASLVAEVGARGSAAVAAQAAQQAARQIPMLQQQEPAAEEAAPPLQQQQQQSPRPIPVIDLSQQQAAADELASRATEQAAVAAAQAQRAADEQAAATQQQQAEQQQQQRAEQQAAQELAAHQRQLQAQQHTDVVVPLGEFDGTLAETAMAQEAAADRPAGSIEAEGGTSSLGDPEHLYPPGRIIWIFPADEDDAAIGETEAEAALELMEVAWEGVVPEAGGAGAAGEPQQPSQQAQQQQQRQPAGGRQQQEAPAGSSRGQHELTNADAAVHGGACRVMAAVAARADLEQRLTRLNPGATSFVSSRSESESGDSPLRCSSPESGAALEGASPTAMLQAEHAERGDEVVAASVQLGGGGGGEAPDVIPAPSPVPRISTRQRNGSSGSLHGSRAASPPHPVLAHPGMMPAYGWGVPPGAYPVYHRHPTHSYHPHHHHPVPHHDGAMERSASPPAVFPNGGSPPLPTGFISVPLQHALGDPGSPTSRHMYGGSPPPYGASPPLYGASPPYGCSPPGMPGSPPPGMVYLAPPPMLHHAHSGEYMQHGGGFSMPPPAHQQDYVHRMAGMSLAQQQAQQHPQQAQQQVAPPPAPRSDSGSERNVGRAEGRASARIARSHRAGGAYDPSDFQFSLEEAEAGGPDARCTLMIRNIPNKYTQAMMLSVLQKSGFSGTFDFFYLPIDFRNKCNLGYCFVNFTTSAAAARLYRQYHAKRWEEYNSRKVCEVTYGRVQGRDLLVEHFKASKFPSEDPELMPLVYTLAESGAVADPLPIHRFLERAEGGAGAGAEPADAPTGGAQAEE
ncbi:Sn1-specific diacylglycerol lipase beta [Micractinium conductrix]|uniref:Sn1-specific diacylglycerol lipase beta n=1 Tax=Micractinium conductrix TaxID=554055 RepID=A0A2P6VPS8_9CHLO|nr:Sn1-specific diacylglycerol lipase beta [Micractinium conductrix]|eukprot:PSC76092.1 Sn1-specific diacylglycerol lipase beta [Micractinium conductrix]